MSIPSPRKFIEIALCIFVTAIVMATMVLSVTVLAIFAGIEALVDKLRKPGRRT